MEKKKTVKKVLAVKKPAPKMLSQKFKEKLKLWPHPQYKVALQAGFNPSSLSKLVIGAQPVQIGDPRLIKVGEIIGLSSDQIFEEININ